jgi:hypothetical protein
VPREAFAPRRRIGDLDDVSRETRGDGDQDALPLPPADKPEIALATDLEEAAKPLALHGALLCYEGIDYFAGAWWR